MITHLERYVLKVDGKLYYPTGWHHNRPIYFINGRFIYPIGGGTAMFAPFMRRFRFYNTGTETGATPIAAEDININPNVDSDFQGQYRALIEETGGSDGSANDDWRLTYDKNGGGGTILTTTDSGDGIRAILAGLTEDGATTDRATGISNPGAGSFIAGLQVGDGFGENLLLTGSNFTEFVFGFEIIAANVADLDFFDFELDRPNSLVSDIIGRLTVAKTGGAVTEVQLLMAQYQPG